MPRKISSAKIDELSLVLKDVDGTEWSPRNPDARVLFTKSAPWLDKFVERVKKGALVDEGCADGVDGDGQDGAEDYENIVSLLVRTNYDLQSASGISDSAARSVAITTVIDNLLASLDSMRKGDDADSGDMMGKAGKRHSASDQAKVDEIGAHVSAMQDLAAKAKSQMGKAKGHVDAMAEHTDAIASAHKGLAPDPDAKDESAKEDATDSKSEKADEVPDAEPVAAEPVAAEPVAEVPADEPQATAVADPEPEPEPESEPDPEPEEPAAPPPEVEVAGAPALAEPAEAEPTPQSLTPKVGEIEMTQEQITEMIASAAKMAAENATAAVTRAMGAQISDLQEKVAKAEADGAAAVNAAQAKATTAEAEAIASKARAAAAVEVAASLGANAMRPTAGSSTKLTKANEASRLMGVIVQTMKNNPISDVI